MSVDLEALLADLLPTGEGCAIYEATAHTPRHLEVYEFYVWETGIVNPPSKMFPDDFAIAAIIARHVAPAEPVTLTAEEIKSMADSLDDAFYEQHPRSLLVWLTEHGFRLVRTGGADDGA